MDKDDLLSSFGGMPNTYLKESSCGSTGCSAVTGHAVKVQVLQKNTRDVQSNSPAPNANHQLVQGGGNELRLLDKLIVSGLNKSCLVRDAVSYINLLKKICQVTAEATKKTERLL
ncbi:hypothetical protein AV530_005396 [Patagioenas fasciata monilis]|uniref:Uncharacterized protein n=1 Tax=Patagioenas fasciata monilis TaxID=372326 RepID=A0A1V4JL63_PATFA|nr:hypothetical protein AV530_005396 [Patagioenas fasciata monilis]